MSEHFKIHRRFCGWGENRSCRRDRNRSKISAIVKHKTGNIQQDFPYLPHSTLLRLCFGNNARIFGDETIRPMKRRAGVLASSRAFGNAEGKFGGVAFAVAFKTYTSVSAAELRFIIPYNGSQSNYRIHVVALILLARRRAPTTHDKKFEIRILLSFKLDV